MELAGRWLCSTEVAQIDFFEMAKVEVYLSTMNQTLNLPTFSPQSLRSSLPLLALLNPRQLTHKVIASLAVGLGLSYFAMTLLGWPKWSATALVLIVMLPIGVLKWRQDHRHYGTTIMLLSILLVSQGAHSIEHLVQWAQYHWFFWTMRQSNGLLSPANAEWVHFVWNWSVLFVVFFLVRGGMRNPWMWLLLSVALLHTVEHTYTFVRYQLVLAELRGMNVFTVTAQGLPGILGRDGWLARSAWTQGTFLCSIPGLTTAVRLDVHFWWNTIEIILLAIGGHFYLMNQPNFWVGPRINSSLTTEVG